MAKQFRIKGSHQQRAHRHAAAELIELAPSSLEVVAGVMPNFLGGNGGAIGLLLIQRSAVVSDAMEFEAEGPRLR